MNKNQDDIRYRELSTLLKFSALITSSLNIEIVLDNAMKWAEEFMDAEASSVYELDEERNELLIRLARGEKKEPMRDLTMKVGEGIAGFVVQTGRPRIVQDVDRESRFSDKFDRITGFRTRSMICVPLVLRDRVVGALQVLNKRDGKPFTRHDLELLTSMAQQVAVAIDNAHLYRRLQERFELTAEELKRTEERLIRSERLAAMGHLVQGVAHEIRNPIMTIGGFAQRIKKELGDDHRLAHYADIIMEEALRLENLVRQVRQFAEAESASLSLGSIESALFEALERCEPMAARQGIQFVKEIPPEPPLVQMDRPRMVTAFYNVLENAMESMPEGGTVHLEVVRENSHIEVRIADTGCGIAPERLDAVYDPFVTSKTRGAGLGLTLAYQIVANHHGEIRIRSELKRGTAVVIRLPVPSASEGKER